jgi:hypothetical protein
MSNEHPLSEDLTKLSDDDLSKKYNELSRRWQIARRMNMDSYVMHQLDIMLDGLESERQRRIMFTIDSNSVVVETDPISVNRDKNT